MVGIYKITNNITGKFYIGQSKDIKRRILAHNAKSHVLEPIDKDITELGKENFTYEVLEECSIEELDEKEDYYINKLNAIELGYNKLKGGQGTYSRTGENNGNCKLTDEDVWDIREAYDLHLGRETTYQKYKHKIGRSGFEKIWQGKERTDYHMDVYDQENLDYYVGKTFTDEEVLECRNLYVKYTPKEIYEMVGATVPYSTFAKMIYGNERYTHLPVYNKKEGCWIDKSKNTD